MSFSQAVSGLNAAAANLDTIGNNISNSATYGFKGANVSFADVFAGSGAGLGVKVAGISQNFKDGSITTTNRPTDVAISGGGFFRIEDQNGGVFYSRNGEFGKNKDGFLTNMQGMRVTGYPVQVVDGKNVVQKGATPTPIVIPTDMMNASATDKINMAVNLNSGEEKPAKAPFNAKDGDTYNFSTNVTTYDSLGNEHNLNLFFVKANDNEWKVYGQDTSTKTAGGAPTPHQDLGTLKYTNAGVLESYTKTDMNIASLNGSAAGTIELDFTGSTQQKVSESSVSKLAQNGYQAGEFTNFRIEQDGSIMATYSNQQSQVVGQIALANFANAGGLSSQGDNMWSETNASGSPIVGVAGAGVFGKLTNNALEASNVDMSQELVNMIVAQRNYQSNAQTIKTQDQILQTLVSLR
ncbi:MULTISPECIES: flagellar hook protein FlgE [Proteus]|jgi:flagellar hook protein FlgE|uniref:Flagellar hook protein FlgE n=2 Tax=Enterobacterales TaxID=91347 RepID=A0A379FC84_PROVU|nr:MULTISPECIES: flagellar hook protein FlgE [Proteus]NBN60340.1 flagellar hook-basal body complex protein [Proteus sp. G2639]RNT28631.1 flagellar hook protein FlgE [Proteus mirabilis]AYY81253.1 flagellar hook protein FlgE [Proteus vulgaris]KGA59264.1 flagellar hook protein flgE [Proteus vulgaris]MBG5972494.1 flagellar hook protein FlgE [Proteus vulgaris]